MTNGQALTKPGVPMVRALERGIALLRAFSTVRPRLTLTELAKAAELDKGTARRLLQTLCLTGLVEQDEAGGTYALSVGVLELGTAVETGRDLREIAAPYLASVSEKTGATTFLWVYHEGMALCIERVRASVSNFDAKWFRVGARTTLNAGGGPRVLLAFISERERKIAMAQPLTARTPATVTDVAALEKAATVTRQQGYELAIDDFIVGLAAVGVPVFDRENRFVGAISITSLTNEIVKDGKATNIEFLKEIAANLGSKII